MTNNNLFISLNYLLWPDLFFQIKIIFINSYSNIIKNSSEALINDLPCGIQAKHNPYCITLAWKGIISS